VLSQDQTLAFNPLSHPTASAARQTHSESSVSSYLRLSILYRFQGSSAVPLSRGSFDIIPNFKRFVNTLLQFF
ncbi:MAG: hypothetical protein J6M20_12090, partial [Clostridia bacterium]|nr:hypothetical protein [Clostridia bacterium]